MLGLQGVSFSYGRQKILEDISLKMNKGEVGCILGPSGCGKSTLIDCILGLKPPTGGCIQVGEKVLDQNQFHLPPEKRHLGVVFQDYALFPHMTALENVRIGLSKRNGSSVDSSTAQQFLELVRLSAQRNHYPHQLSGGQQQRVALARALASRPDVLLLDEPFSNIDHQLRDHLLAEIKEILLKTQVTTLMVTHSHEEAFALADRIGILANQQLVAWGTPHELYCKPPSVAIARMLGPCNVVAAERIEQATFRTPFGVLQQDQAQFLEESPDQWKMIVRPEQIRLHHQQKQTRAGLPATITTLRFAGPKIHAKVMTPDNEVLECHFASCHAGSFTSFSAGMAVQLGLELNV